MAVTVVTSRVRCADGTPAAGVYVYAWLLASSTALHDGSRVAERVHTYTGRDGRWRLELPAAASMLDPVARWSIREVGYDAYLVGVPVSSTPVEAGDLSEVPGEPPTGGEPPPPAPGGGNYVTRAELGIAGGVATLDDNRLVPFEQLPADELAADWFSGDGPPGTVLGARRGDMYLDRTTGELYRLG